MFRVQEMRLGPGWCGVAQLVGAGSPTPEGGSFKSRSGHMPSVGASSR